MTTPQLIRKHIVASCKGAFMLWNVETVRVHEGGLKFKVKGTGARCYVWVTQKPEAGLFDVAFGVHHKRIWTEAHRAAVAATDIFKTIDEYIA